MGLSPQQAKMLLGADDVKLAKRVADPKGKPLSANERAELEKIAATAPVNAAPGNKPEPKFVKNHTELAEVLGCSRKTIQRYAKRKDCPQARSDGRHSVAEWKSYLQKFEAVEPEESSDISEEKLKGEKLRNWRIAFKNQEIQKNYWPKDIVKQVCAQAVHAAKTRQFAGIPRLVSIIKMAKDDATAIEEARKELSQVWRQMESSEWFQPPPEPPKESEAAK